MYALGGNPENIQNGNDTINLVLDGTFDFHGGSPGLQGTNGLAYALLSVDANNYPESQGSRNTRQTFINEILACQKEDGAFALDPGFGGDVDITAMVLQALAPYKNEPSVKIAIESALGWISSQLTDECKYISYNSDSVESIAQTILALCALGIDPVKDERFVRGGVSLLDSMNDYRTIDGLYIHSTSDSEHSMLSTYQALLALEAIEKLRTDGSWILDFTTYHEPASIESNNKFILLTIGGAVVLIVTAVLCVKNQKRNRYSGGIVICTKKLYKFKMK